MSGDHQQTMLDEEFPQAITRWFADNGPAIDIPHGLISLERGGRFERTALLIGDEEGWHGQAANEILQSLVRRPLRARDVDFGVRYAKFLQAQTSQLLIGAGAFTCEHE